MEKLSNQCANPLGIFHINISISHSEQNEHDRKNNLYKYFLCFSTDSAKSIIYGTDPSAVLDTDKFSEISLDQPVDSELTTTQQEYNPLQNLDTFSPLTSDEQQRQQQQQLQNQRDELLFNPLAQAAAIKDSLSQLPGVASSVLSSFSSILKGRTSPYSAGEELHAPNVPSSASPYPNQLTEGESEGQENVTGLNQFPSYYAQSIQEQSPEIPPVAPTFYSPTDPLILRPEASLSPPSASGESTGNLYRLKERKKLYAPIPGLNANNNSNPIPLNQIQSNPIPPIPSAPSAPEINPAYAPANQNASFSISSFFNGASLLDKVLPKQSNPTADISSAGESCAQQMFIDHSSQATSNAAFEPFSISSHQSNTSEATTPFSITTPPSQIHSVSPSQSIPPPVLPNTFKLNPFGSVPAQNQAAAAAPPSASTAHLFNIGASPPPPQPLHSISDSPIAQPVNVETPPAPQFFNPSSTPQPANAPSFYQPSAIPSVPVSTEPNPFQAPPPNPTLYQPSASPVPALVQQTPIPPTYLPQSIPPSGQVTSYRLQGKPHYKKPIQSTQFPNQVLNAQPSQLFMPLPSAQPSIPASNFHIFNPLAFDSSQQPEIQTQAQAQAPPSAQIQPSLVQAPHPTASSSANPLLPPPLPPSVSTPLNDTVNLYRKVPVDSGITAAQSNICTSFNQTLPKTEDSNLNQSHQPIVPPTSNVSLTPPPPQLLDSSAYSNPFQPAVFNINTAAPGLTTDTLPEPPTPQQLEPFGQPEEPKLLNEIQPTSKVEQTALFTADNTTPAVEHPTIQNFFEPSTTFDPFQVAQNNLILDNTKQTLDSENKNLENVNSGLQGLALDNENNFVDDSVANTNELNTFDPASYFSNSNNNISINDNNSCNDNASDQCVKSIASNPNEFQNFFNEPPPLSDLQENVQENNFNFIRTNLLNKRIERIANAETASPETLSVASVIAEPGSSAPSERSFADPPSVADGSVQPLPSVFESNPVIVIHSFILVDHF